MIVRRTGFFDPTTAAILLAAVLLGVYAFMENGGLRRDNPSEPSTLPFDRAAVTKLGWNDRDINILLLGDSRTYMGVSPSAMRTVLPDVKIRNYAFRGLGFRGDYLDSTFGLVREASPPKMVVLGITTGSLTERSRRRNEWTTTMDGRGEGWSAKLDQSVDRIVPPTTPTGWVTRWTRRGNPGRRGAIHDYQTDGYCRSDSQPRRPNAAIAKTKLQFESTEISSDTLADLYAFTDRCVDSGIIVVGFRPPATRSMHDMEHQTLGRAVERVAEGLIGRGGYWIDIPVGVHESYDGSHLTPEGATGLSVQLAHRLQQIIASGPAARR